MLCATRRTEAVPRRRALRICWRLGAWAASPGRKWPPSSSTTSKARPFTCKIKTELGLDEALAKFATKYRKKHGRDPPPLEAPGHRRRGVARPARQDRRLPHRRQRQGAGTTETQAETAAAKTAATTAKRNGPRRARRAAPEAGGETNKRSPTARRGASTRPAAGRRYRKATRGLATVDLKRRAPADAPGDLRGLWKTYKLSEV